MKDYAQRRHEWAKHARRRSRFYYTVADSQREYEHGGRDRFAELPSFRFIGRDSRLLILYYMFRACQRRQEFKWFGYQHGCPCALCRGHYRKPKGNSLRLKSIQTRRELLAGLE